MQNFDSSTIITFSSWILQFEMIKSSTLKVCPSFILKHPHSPYYWELKIVLSVCNLLQHQKLVNHVIVYKHRLLHIVYSRRTISWSDIYEPSCGIWLFQQACLCPGTLIRKLVQESWSVHRIEFWKCRPCFHDPQS